MRLDDFKFELPDELIARYPLKTRSESRLLCLNQHNHEFAHRRFYEVVNLIRPGDLVVFNDTKVIPARLFGQKTTGGQVEILVERILDQQRVIAQVRVSKAPKIGDDIIFANDIRFQVVGRQQQFYELRYNQSDKTILQVIEALGEIPLPPYMQRKPDATDLERYQTVYAKNKGSVAAPTAGLHFDEALLTQLRDNQVEFGYLTLHIGAGTFAPVRTDDIREHTMHAEYLEVSADLCEKIKATKARGNRVIAVGTTSMRALESASQSGETLPYHDETNIFIYPGYQFRCVDVLITNLHLPGSTLLMLVSAFAGYQKIMDAYAEAVREKYRFYSYGDAMWMEREVTK